MITLEDLSDQMIADPDGAAEILGLGPFEMSYASILYSPVVRFRSFAVGHRSVTATTTHPDGRSFDGTIHYAFTLEEQRRAARNAKNAALWEAIRAGVLPTDFTTNTDTKRGDVLIYKWTVRKSHTDWTASRTPSLVWHFATHQQAFDYAFRQAIRAAEMRYPV